MVTQQSSQRIRTETRNGVTVYSAGFWPGWTEVINLCIAFLAVSGVFACAIGILYPLRQIFYGNTFGPVWLHRVLSFVIMGAFDMTAAAGLSFLVLWIPYFLVYQLSPKQFWIEDNILFQTVRLFGLIPHRRKIPFEQILDIQACECNGRYAVTVLYERTLPKWLFIVLVHWNEKLTQWPMTLVNGIPTMAEAQHIQNALLEPMTASPACRIGD